jgi:hypothetical protein
MKKSIAFFSVLLTVGTLAFAQDNPIKFSGLMYSTVGYDVDDKAWGGADVMIDGASMSFLYYTRLGLDYDRSNYGFAFSMMAISGYDTSAIMRAPLPSVYQAYGWANFFEKKLEVKMGAVRDSTFNSGGRISTDGGEGAGIMLKFNPFTGFSVGGGVYAPRLPTATEITANPAVSTNGSGPLELGTFSGGVAYEMSKVFKITAAGGWRNDTTPTATAGIHLLAVPNLTAVFEFFSSGIQWKNLDAYSPFIAFDQTVTYRIGSQLSFGLNAYQFLNNTNRLVSKGGNNKKTSATTGASSDPFASASAVAVKTDSVANGIPIHYENTFDLGFSFDPWISYQIGMFVPRLNFTIEHYGNTNETIMNLPEALGGPSTTTTETQRFLISVKPQISLRIGMASIDLSYTLSMLNDTVNDKKEDPVFDNKVTAMFTMVF